MLTIFRKIRAWFRRKKIHAVVDPAACGPAPTKLHNEASGLRWG
jgi:hypothetical protein